jgi:hypothetical protein
MRPEARLDFGAMGCRRRVGGICRYDADDADDDDCDDDDADDDADDADADADDADDYDCDDVLKRLRRRAAALEDETDFTLKPLAVKDDYRVLVP